MQVMAEKTSVAIHTVAPHSGEAGFICQALDNGHLLTTLRERDLHPVITHKSTYSEIGQGYSIELINDRLVLSPANIAVDGLSAVYSRVVTPHPYIDDRGLPQLNPTSLKRFGRSKSNAIGKMGSLEIPTYITQDEDVFDLLDLNLDYVVKPDKGRMGTGVQIIKGGDLPKRFKQLFADTTDRHVIQPYLGAGQIPQDVTGVSSKDQGQLESARKNRIPTELRIFVVKNSGSFKIATLARIAAKDTNYLEGNDQYVDAVFEHTTAETIVPAALDIVDRITSETGTDNTPTISAVDFLFDGEKYWVMEANFRSPTLPLTHNNPSSASTLNSAVADTLLTMSEVGHE